MPISSHHCIQLKAYKIVEKGAICTSFCSRWVYHADVHHADARTRMIREEQKIWIRIHYRVNITNPGSPINILTIRDPARMLKPMDSLTIALLILRIYRDRRLKNELHSLKLKYCFTQGEDPAKPMSLRWPEMRTRMSKLKANKALASLPFITYTYRLMQ